MRRDRHSDRNCLEGDIIVPKLRRDRDRVWSQRGAAHGITTLDSGEHHRTTISSLGERRQCSSMEPARFPLSKISTADFAPSITLGYSVNINRRFLSDLAARPR
eukprot:gene25532-11179_t